MATNLTRKEQKDKWSWLHKAAFTEELLTAQPRDFQERNRIYQIACSVLSYPLQAISIFAGAYLLFDVFGFVWHIELFTFYGGILLGVCGLVFLGIESLRRWLVSTTGYNYLTTFKIVSGKLKKGEWIRSNVYVLSSISILLIISGTWGVYEYIKNNSPQAAIQDVRRVVSPFEQKIIAEKTQLTQLDGKIQALMTTKSQELKDARSYGIWKGREYLLPEVKTRHQNYDRQIAALQIQRQNHQQLIFEYEKQRQQKENRTEQKNQTLEGRNEMNKELYAGFAAGIWLGFEGLLVLMLAYPWYYLYHAKRERLLEQLALPSHSAAIEKTETVNQKGYVVHSVSGLNGQSYPQNIGPVRPEVGFENGTLPLLRQQQSQAMRLR
ncbi:MAG: hypothetical protein HC913_15955 [Microscillaceae bacterium]|nr:hypothetical protein [Microscillaceae bacterium]